jgi:predicted nucleotidyltransferase
MLSKGDKPFFEALGALQNLLAKFDYRGVIIGGIAVGFLGRPRLTEDIDAMFILSVNDIPRFLDAASEENIQPRIKNAEDFARKNRVLLLRHLPTEINIDISLGALLFEEEMVDRSVLKKTGAISIQLPTPEDLIIMKAIAHRPKDLEDIRTIVDNNPKLDKKRIQTWVKSFADALESPGLWPKIKAILDGTENE